jgi:hypothetical protein
MGKENEDGDEMEIESQNRAQRRNTRALPEHIEQIFSLGNT